MFNCKKNTEKTTRYIDNQMSFKERLAYKIHLLMCGHCRRFVNQFKSMVQSISFLQLENESQLSEKIIKIVHQNNISGRS